MGTWSLSRSLTKNARANTGMTVSPISNTLRAASTDSVVMSRHLRNRGAERERPWSGVNHRVAPSAVSSSGARAAEYDADHLARIAKRFFDTRGVTTVREAHRL